MLLMAMLVGACQNDYPLEPTPCDDFCRATQRKSCDDNDPAWCVSNCEDSRIVQLDEPGCQELWDAALDCYAALPEEDVCYGWFGFTLDPGGPCGVESGAYYVNCLAENPEYYEGYDSLGVPTSRAGAPSQ
jgi:hypothetical protein